eukprot:1472979-Rhodomonas_salina.2
MRGCVRWSSAARADMALPASARARSRSKLSSRVATPSRCHARKSSASAPAPNEPCEPSSTREEEEEEEKLLPPHRHHRRPQRPGRCSGHRMRALPETQGQP